MADTLQDLLGQAAQQGSSSDEDVLRSLIQQHMTQGLGINTEIGGHQGQATFSGPVAGYAGHLRPSDVPDVNAGADIPVYNGATLSPGTLQARVQAGGPFRGVLPDAQAQQLMRGLQASSAAGLPGAVNADIAKGLLEKYGIAQDPMAKLAQQLALRSAQKQQDKLTTPLGTNSDKYVNMNTGERATPDMTLGDVSGKGTQFKAISTAQEKQIEALNNLKTHIQLTEQYLNALPDSTSLATGGRAGNKIAMWLATQANNPDAVAFADQLQSMTPVSTARAFLGSGGRVGPGAAKLLAESNVTTGDDKISAQKKLANLKFVLTDLARENGLPVKPYEAAFKGSLTAGKGTAAPSSSGAPVAVNSPDEARKLPKGTLFTTPDGRTLRVK